MTAAERDAITRARDLLVRSRAAFRSGDVATARGILDGMLGESVDDIVDEGPPGGFRFRPWDSTSTAISACRLCGATACGERTLAHEADCPARST